jgi:hypothetical protein
MVGGIAMEKNQRPGPVSGLSGAELVKNRDAIAQLARSGDAKRLITLLQQQGEVQKAAEAAAAGDTGGLAQMVKQLTQTPEGAAVVERLRAQAEKAGLQ